MPQMAPILALPMYALIIFMLFSLKPIIYFSLEFTQPSVVHEKKTTMFNWLW